MHYSGIHRTLCILQYIFLLTFIYNSLQDALLNWVLYCLSFLRYYVHLLWKDLYLFTMISFNMHNIIVSQCTAQKSGERQSICIALYIINVWVWGMGFGWNSVAVVSDKMLFSTCQQNIASQPEVVTTEHRMEQAAKGNSWSPVVHYMVSKNNKVNSKKCSIRSWDGGSYKNVSHFCIVVDSYKSLLSCIWLSLSLAAAQKFLGKYRTFESYIQNFQAPGPHTNTWNFLGGRVR